MLNNFLFDATQIPLLKKSLDAYGLRHRAISDNIANAETPGFSRRTVKFEEKLEEAMKNRGAFRSHSGHLHTVAERLNLLEPEIKIDESLPEPGSVNNVNIDREMTALAKNTMQYNFAAHMSRMFFEHLNTAIRGTG